MSQPLAPAVTRTRPSRCVGVRAGVTAAPGVEAPGSSHRADGLLECGWPVDVAPRGAGSGEVDGSDPGYPWGCGLGSPVGAFAGRRAAVTFEGLGTRRKCPGRRTRSPFPANRLRLRPQGGLSVASALCPEGTGQLGPVVRADLGPKGSCGPFPEPTGPWPGGLQGRAWGQAVLGGTVVRPPRQVVLPDSGRGSPPGAGLLGAPEAWAREGPAPKAG